MEDVESLKEEIEILEKRISILEKIEGRRKVKTYISIIIKIILIGFVAFSVWKAYDYVTNYIPNLIKNQINELNPVDDIKDKISDLNPFKKD